MGVFDFVREAGAKIGIGDSKAEKEAKAEAASAERAAEMAKRIRARKARKASEAAAEAKMERLQESKKASGLEAYVKNLGFDVDGLDIRYDDGLATVSGTVADQETREKVILAIGNVSDVGTVQDDIKVTNDADESELHMVVSGDTLSAIAKDRYGDASKYPVIFEANKPMLTDPDKIYVGQVLRIPAL